VAYDIEVEPGVLKSLRGIAEVDRAKVIKKIDSLGENPRPHGVEKLTDVEGFRVRVGVYRIDDPLELVLVTRVSHRRDVYRRH
jgi:mRNA interferase RelE/StbE